MDANVKSEFLFEDVKNNYLFSGDDKFKIVSCPINRVNCTSILPELNRLYAMSELARINKEYLSSTELLQKAYDKTLELKESPCANCVNLFQNSIGETLETMQKEVNQISFGLFYKKRYERVHIRLSNLLKKINPFHPGEATIFSAKKSSPAGVDL